MLKVGSISFGGPAAHISLLQDEVVERRQWLDAHHFLDLVAATNLIPGPNASEMAMYIGLIRAGWIGLVVGGLAFLLPGAILSGLLAWVYLRYGALPEISRVFSLGIEPVVLVVVLATEPPRDCRRPNSLRGWDHGETKQVLSRGAGTSGTDGV